MGRQILYPICHCLWSLCFFHKTKVHVLSQYCGCLYHFRSCLVPLYRWFLHRFFLLRQGTRYFSVLSRLVAFYRFTGASYYYSFLEHTIFPSKMQVRQSNQDRETLLPPPDDELCCPILMPFLFCLMIGALILAIFSGYEDSKEPSYPKNFFFVPYLFHQKKG